jgi:hypothetical protein
MGLYFPLFPSLFKRGSEKALFKRKEKDSDFFLAKDRQCG